MQKSIVIVVLVIIIITGMVFSYKILGNDSRTTRTNTNCIQEGDKSNGEVPVVYQCCPGLQMIGAIDNAGNRTYDVAFCTKCGDRRCKKPENKFNCPADCQ